MKLYDNVMVPANEKETSPHFIAGGMWECKTGQICMTIEELREAFVAGMNYVKEQSVTNGVDFPAYMESKGIKIQNK